VTRALIVGISVAAIAAFAGGLSARGANDPLQDSRQAILVVTDGWDAVNGTLERFERASPGAAWRAVGGRVAVVVGRNGLAWGKGLVPAPEGGPVKREGDDKAPAGVFALTEVFGQAHAGLSAWTMPYRPLGSDVECVDDAKSPVYNMLVTKNAAPGAGAAWTRSEKMWQEPLYRWGVVVAHNPAKLPGSGSCIFMHIWGGLGHGTAGCTAMDEAALTEVIGWLTPAGRPTLVQLPRAEYERLEASWKLPQRRRDR
jgi:zinc D-Ala-D-Ala dipeptidase